METPEAKLESTKNHLITLDADLYKTEDEIEILSKKKDRLISEIKKTKDRISLLETVADQYEELVKNFESKRKDLLMRIE